MTDRYEFEKSTMPQGVDMETPFSKKNFNFIQDINAGSYSSGSGVSLVQFDCQSIFSSTSLINASETYLTIPITYATAWTDSSGNMVTPLSNAWASTGLKGGYWQLLNGIDVTCDGKVLEQYVPNLNQYVSVRLLSELSKDDLSGIGATIGLSDTLDNWESMSYSNNLINYNLASGSAVNSLTPGAIANGMSNNAPFPLNIPATTQAAGTGVTNATTVNISGANSSIIAGQLVSGQGIPQFTYVVSNSGSTTIVVSQAVTTTTGATLSFYNSQYGNFGDSQTAQVQYSGSYNNGLFSRLKRIPDCTQVATKNYNNFYGGTGSNNSTCLTNSSLMKNEFRPYFTVTNKVCYWYDIAVIRLKDVLDSFKCLPMLQKFSCQLRLYLNVGSVVSNVVGGVGNGYMLTSGSSNTFTNTCPLMQCALNTYPVPVTGYSPLCMTSGLFIGSPQSTSISVQGGSVNLYQAGAAHFMNACRLYYSCVQLKPEKMSHYITSNSAKRVCFKSVLNNTFTNISANATSSFLVQAGVQNIKGIWILPYISSSVNGQISISSATSALVQPFSQCISPFDTAPITVGGPISLINLQCAIGGQNVLSLPINYSYEHWLQEVGLYEQMNAGDIGISNYVYNQSFWENCRSYYLNLERCNPAEQKSARNITLTFTNNSAVPIDVQIFTEYYREMIVDVGTGAIDIVTV